MQIEDIEKGQAVEIEVICDGKTMNFKSNVILVNDNSVLIASITVDDLTLGFSDKYQVNFVYKLTDKLFIWENVTAKLVKYEDGIYHRIELIGDGQPYNRRSAYRVYVGADMPIFVNTSTGPSFLSVLVKDISECGVSFISKEDLQCNRSFRLKLTDENTVMNLFGIIIRKEFLDHLGSNLYGCKFTEKNFKLGKYIVKKQSEFLKRKSESIIIIKNKTGLNSNKLEKSNKNQLRTSKTR